MKYEFGTGRPNGAPAREPPDVKALSDEGWRKDCQQRFAKIPAGYTYLAQLMGHDMGHSVDRLQRRVVIPPGELGVNPAGQPLEVVRYNLIEHPLTLETIYGPSPKLLSHLYDDNWLFRLRPDDRIAWFFWPDEANLGPVRALYDERNRDTLMLQHLAVFWMQFHNLIAQRLIKAGDEPQLAFFLARDHVISVWHHIISDDILPRFVHADIFDSFNGVIPELQMDELSLLHGLFRAFHAMPLADYPIGRPTPSNKPIKTLMKVDFSPINAETQHWFINWTDFFSSDDGQVRPKSGISASIEPTLRIGSAMLMAMDGETAEKVWPNRLTSPTIDDARKMLPNNWSTKITPAQMAGEFSKRWPRAPFKPNEKTLTDAPLFLALMVEAQLYGRNGGFGPLGSALLLHSVKAAMARLSKPDLPRAKKTDPLPAFKSIAELIAFVEKERTP